MLAERRHIGCSHPSMPFPHVVKRIVRSSQRMHLEATHFPSNIPSVQMVLENLLLFRVHDLTAWRTNNSIMAGDGCAIIFCLILGVMRAKYLRTLQNTVGGLPLHTMSSLERGFFDDIAKDSPFSRYSHNINVPNSCQLRQDLPEIAQGRTR
jgi:hypothetical protein